MDKDIVNEWAIQIAEAAAPDEVDLAPMMIHAYLKGGRDRKDLFCQPKSDVAGGFGTGEFQAILPWIIQGIVTAAPLIHTAVTSEVVSKYLSAVTDLLSIRDSLARKKKVEASPNDPYVLIKRLHDSLSKDLSKVKMPQEQRDLIIYHVIEEVLKSPNSETVIKKLSGARK